MKLLLFAALVAAALAETEYTLQVKTKDVQWADSDGYFYGLAIGFTGKVVDLGRLDNRDRDDFQRAGEDVFTYTSDVDVGKIACLLLRAANMSDDGWIIDTFKISSTTDTDGFSGVNPNSDWLSGQWGEGNLAMVWCKDE